MRLVAEIAPYTLERPVQKVSVFKLKYLRHLRLLQGVSVIKVDITLTNHFK